MTEGGNPEPWRSRAERIELERAARRVERAKQRKPKVPRDRSRAKRPYPIGRTIIWIAVLLVCFTKIQGVPDFSASGPVSLTDQLRMRLTSGSGFPPPPDDQQDQPFGRPAPIPAGSGPYKFLQTQRGSDEPAAFDPCQPIHIVVNHRTEPADAEGLLEMALDMVSEATGLRFVIDGATSEPPTADRAALDDERYPGRWSPVLIAWTDPIEWPDLTGDTIGTGGPTPVVANGAVVFVSGTVALDGPAFTQLLAHFGPETRELTRTVIAHEIGHLVGLDHVDDATQVMNASGSSVTEFGVGDRLGLAQLGAGQCFSSF